jgi:hypothetical protein
MNRSAVKNMSNGVRMEVRPFEGLGDLRFGMSRADVRALLGPEFRSFKKTPLAKTLTDAYTQLGLHLYYDDQDRLEFIEAFQPCIPIFRGIELLGRPEVVLEQLRKTGVGIPRRDSDGNFFDDLGFALYSPGDVVEGVSVYKKGYYDKR